MTTGQANYLAIISERSQVVTTNRRFRISPICQLGPNATTKNTFTTKRLHCFDRNTVVCTDAQEKPCKILFKMSFIQLSHIMSHIIILKIQ